MTITQPTGPDLADPSPEVANRLVQIFNDGSIAVLASLGHQSGLFETMAALPPATSVQIADAAGLNERYVRELLGGIVTAGFVDYDPAAQTYLLRPDHVPFLAGAGPDNLARVMQYVTLMGQVTPGVLHAFREGGGLSYADYPGFHDLQAADSGAIQDAYLIDRVLPLTGQVAALEAGLDVADVACGEGHALNLMARAFPNSRFTGLDFEEEAIRAARAEAAAWGLTNASFEVRDVAAGLGVAAYDFVSVFDAIHDQAEPARVLAAIRASLREGGTFLMGDMDASSHLENNLELPWAGFFYAISTTHCMAVSLGQGGAGLGTVWGVELAEQMVREAGFGTVSPHRIEENPFEVYLVARH